FLSRLPPSSTLFPYTTLFRSRAGVEDEDVRFLTVGRRLIARVLEEPGESLGIVNVHLAAEGADLVGALFGLLGCGSFLLHSVSHVCRSYPQSGSEHEPCRARHCPAHRT